MRRISPKQKRLLPRPWMRAASTMQVMKALGGHRGEARFVGGCVRDSLMGLPVHDIDIAVRYRPLETLKRLKRTGIIATPISLAHGVVLTFQKGRIYEISSLRCDVETDGRWARVQYSRSWRQDAGRRDFTINALYADGWGRLYDPFGGWSDLKRGVVRFIGDAQARVREDRLRVLRYYRFFARYGWGPPDRTAARACRAAAADLVHLSAERVWNELKCLLATPHCLRGLALMADHDVLACILPEAGGQEYLARLLTLEADWDGGDPIRRLAVLLRPDSDIGSLAGRLKMSRREKQRLVLLQMVVGDSLPLDTAADLRRLIYEYGTASVADLILVRAARLGSSSMSANWQTILRTESVPVFPLKGSDLKNLGVLPGPGLGTLLKTIQSWWKANDFQASRTACLDYAAALIDSDGLVKASAPPEAET